MLSNFQRSVMFQICPDWFLEMVYQNLCPQSEVQKQPPEVFCKKGVLRNFAKFTGKHLCQSFFFNKVSGPRTATLLKKRLWRSVFSCEFCEISRDIFFTEHLRETGSEGISQRRLVFTGTKRAEKK